ncbi:hypothetical protein [Paenibacillus rigui]|uniref:Glycosyltransferase RgtA/B/C/D-like domain-containing protein n=1 Tax=Paenibacillus rigui TaxID=554312 RepID=A0A229UKN2_9BACL|nr:hypothetical protein [Paenibacillus rigui]OXM83956.1 hypothetical protein CF651_22855 [Paenibacillus rigui]
MTNERIYSLSKFNKYENGFILAIALIASIYFTFISYPGFLYSDSFARWNFVKLLMSDTQLEGNAKNWLTVVPALFMALCYRITDNIGAFTLIQSFLFFFTGLHLVKEIRNNVESTVLISLLYVTFPIFAIFSVYHATDIFVVIGCNMILVSTFRQMRNGRHDNLYLYSLLTFIAFVFIFGFRQNALSMIPMFALLCFFLYRKIRSKSIVIVQTVALVLSLIGISVTPHIMNIYKYDVSAVGTGWEIISAIKLMKDANDPAYEKYSAYLDYLGNTKLAVEQNQDTSIWGAYTGDKLSLDLAATPENASRIKRDYLNLALDKQKFFLVNKINFIKRSLGIGHDLGSAILLENDHTEMGMMKEYGVSDTLMRREMYQDYKSFVSDYPIIKKPYALFLIDLILLGVASLIYRNKTKLFPYYMIYGFAVFYYLGFLITTQSHEFRYFFPSMFFIVLISSSLVIDTIITVVKNAVIKLRTTNKLEEAK